MPDMRDLAAAGHIVEYIRPANSRSGKQLRSRGSMSESPSLDVAIPEPRPFRIAVPEETLEDLERRLRTARFGEALLPRQARIGLDQSQLTQLLRYWREDFDWRRVESELNRFEHLLVTVDGLDLHALHARGEGPDPLPLIVMHGWPSSFVE